MELLMVAPAEVEQPRLPEVLGAAMAQRMGAMAAAVVVLQPSCVARPILSKPEGAGAAEESATRIKPVAQGVLAAVLRE